MTEAEGDTIAAQRAALTSPLFEARNITKSFGETRANRDISLTVAKGEKHALLGENGAGKSTFVKMIDGVLRPDSGSFHWNGKRISISSPANARKRGIGMVFQHFSSFEALTVAENIALALPHLSRGSIRKKIREISDRYGLSVDPTRRVERLSAGEKQRVEIVRALLQEPKLLILDEPTSVLTPQEADGLFDTLNALSNEGMSLIYISHRLSEISALCDRATILRQGAVVATCNPAQTSAPEMAEMMIGKVAEPLRRRDAFVGGVRLEVTNLSMPVADGMPLKSISFGARRGEILGIAGVAGEGQDALFAALSGERRTPYQNAIKIEGKPVGSLGTNARRRLGAAFAPEQRLGHAAIGDLSLSENLRLTRHALRAAGPGSFRNRAKVIRESYDVRAGSGDPKAGTLSGGNLQKFVIGRELDREPKVFIAAQPTWGVDAGAAAFIRGELMELAARGSAVVVISQDLDEIFQIADRVAVMHLGTLSDTYLIDDMTPEKIGLLMTGSDPAEADDRAEQTFETSTTAPIEAPPHAVQNAPASAAALAVPMVAPKRGASPAPDSAPNAPIRSILTVHATLTTPWTPREQFQRIGPES